MMYPPPLKQGDCIGVMATSCCLDEKELFPAKAFMEERGYEVFIHPQATARLNQSAGSAQEKADAFHDLIRNPDIKMIMVARGGNRATTMLDKIDFDLVRHHPKILIGYSDVTALLNSVYKEAGIVTYHGPLFRELPSHPNFDAMLDTVSGKTNKITMSGCRVLQGGETGGVMLGGNLSLFQALQGTPYAPDMHRAILFLEDIGDHISRYDRMFTHLRNTGMLKNIAALLVGQFTDMKDSTDNPFGFTLEDILREHTAGLNIPIIMDAPFGHGDALPTFPVGAPIKLTASEETVKLSFS